jgi:hypothetical protein
MEIFNAALLH